MGQFWAAEWVRFRLPPPPLTYFGIAVEEGDRGRLVQAIDPEGPGAATDLRVGDQIFGYFPTRVESITLRGDFSTPYAFGLTLFEPNQERYFIDFWRDGEEHQTDLTPRLIQGGEKQGLAPGDTEALDRFFGTDGR